MTGVIEIVGTFIGYFAVKIAVIMLPFALSFAGGTMIYVICDEMIPEMRSNSNGVTAVFALIAGFCFMLAVDFFL
jgi:ZIP family zinc transporter